MEKRKFIISETQEKELIKRLNEETYQMPVDKKNEYTILYKSRKGSYC